ncbi:hypothetical protein [Ligilactobacillus aviarius]|nr:hypothetical protein [Ligilactobacillus aviarius]
MNNNPIIKLQGKPAKTLSTNGHVAMRNSGFSFSCRGQSTLSIRCD